MIKSRRSVPQFIPRNCSAGEFVVHGLSVLIVVIVDLIVSELDDGLDGPPQHEHEETVVQPKLN